MEQLDLTTLFWLFTLGMVIGTLTKVVMGNKGLKLKSNIIAGVTGSIIVGGIGIEMQLPGSLMFALLGSLSVLFLANVFFLQPELEDH